MPWALGRAQPGLSVARTRGPSAPGSKDQGCPPCPKAEAAWSSLQHSELQEEWAGSRSLQEIQKKQTRLEQDSAFSYLHLFISSVEIKTCPNLCSLQSRS